ncbi:MAG: hypothetical protein Kow0069_12240 [Promethearchaeota archaeon]
MARAMSLVEVASLEALTFLDRYLLPGIFKRVMWLAKGSWGAVVVPLGTNLDETVQVAPSEEILEIVKRCRVVAVGQCYCRRRNEDRRYPSETCVILGESYDLEEVERFHPLEGSSRQISVEELEDLLKKCDRAGLVHQLIFFPSPRFFYVICNCAPESCTALRNLIRHGAPSVVKSNFAERTNEELCTACGTCVERCPFGARSVQGGRLGVNSARCFGCGLCVPTCPAKAVKLVRRRASTAASNPAAAPTP